MYGNIPSFSLFSVSFFFKNGGASFIQLHSRRWGESVAKLKCFPDTIQIKKKVESTKTSVSVM